MVRVNRRLERKLARLERNRPVEMRRKFEAAERLVVMVRASLDGRLVGDEEMRREVERFERV